MFLFLTNSCRSKTRTFCLRQTRVCHNQKHFVLGKHEFVITKNILFWTNACLPKTKSSWLWQTHMYPNHVFCVLSTMRPYIGQEKPETRAFGGKQKQNGRAVVSVSAVVSVCVVWGVCCRVLCYVFLCLVSCVLWFVSCVSYALCLVSCVLCRVSCVLCLLSCVLCLVSCVLCLVYFVPVVWGVLPCVIRFSCQHITVHIGQYASASKPCWL